MPILLSLPQGQIETGNNEVSIVSTVDDPSGIRLASSTPEPGLGHVSGNALRSDGAQEMVCMIQLKRWEATRQMGSANLHGAMEFWIRDPRKGGTDDSQFVKAFTVEPDGIHLYLPIINHV